MDRVIIFLLACVPARILFALTAYLWKSPLLALPAIAIAAGLLYNLIVRRGHAHTFSRDEIDAHWAVRGEDDADEAPRAKRARRTKGK